VTETGLRTGLALAGGLFFAAVRRGLITLALVAGSGLGTAAPATAASTLAASGDATSITAHSADLNGAVYRERVGARWLFEYSTSSTFSTSLLSTPPVLLAGRLTVVERQISGLAPGATYYWRVVLAVRSGTTTAQTVGATRTFETLTAPAPTS
jgi:hypothetical protein